MFRAILYLILIAVLISVLRGVIGIFSRAAGIFWSGQAGPGNAQGPRRNEPQRVGELRKDPVCGTFVSTTTAFQKTVGGETHYFCSADCLAKFHA